MSADWDCEHCGRLRGASSHTCDPVDIAERVEADFEERIDDLEDQIVEMAEVIKMTATLAATLQERVAALEAKCAPFISTAESINSAFKEFLK